MQPQTFTKGHQSLKAYLLEVVKLKPEQFRFGDTHGDVKGKVDVITSYSTTDSLQPGIEIEVLPDDTQLRFSHEYTIHLIVKEFAGELTFFLAQMVFWLAQVYQDEQFDYKVYWNNDTSANLECWFDIVERGFGTLADGMVVK